MHRLQQHLCQRSFLFNLSNRNYANYANYDWGLGINNSYGLWFGTEVTYCTLFMNSSGFSNFCVTNGYGEFNIANGQALSTFLVGTTSANTNNLEHFGLTGI